MTSYFVLFGSTQEFFFSTSAHFITHPLSPMPRLFQPSCLYQHDTSLGLVSSPSCSKSGHHSRNHAAQTPTLHRVYVSPNKKNRHSKQTVNQNSIPAWPLCSFLQAKNQTLKYYLFQSNCMSLSGCLNVNSIINYSNHSYLSRLDVWIYCSMWNFDWWLYTL